MCSGGPQAQKKNSCVADCHAVDTVRLILEPQNRTQALPNASSNQAKTSNRVTISNAIRNRGIRLDKMLRTMVRARFAGLLGNGIAPDIGAPPEIALNEFHLFFAATCVFDEFGRAHLGFFGG